MSERIINAPTDSESQTIRIGDKVHMLRSEYDGDHEWDDVVTELVYYGEGGGDEWVVRGENGEAWACFTEVYGHVDEETYEYGLGNTLLDELATAREVLSMFVRLAESGMVMCADHRRMKTCHHYGECTKGHCKLVKAARDLGVC